MDLDFGFFKDKGENDQSLLIWDIYFLSFLNSDMEIQKIYR